MSNVIQFIVDKFYYIFLGLLGAYVLVKIRNRHSDKKRRIFFILAIGVFLIYTGSIMILQGMIPPSALYIIVLAVIIAEVYFIRRFWLFRMDCSECGKRMEWNTIILDDRNLCSDCLAARESPAEGAELEEASGGPGTIEETDADAVAAEDSTKDSPDASDD